MLVKIFNEKTKWIWKAGGVHKDEYAEFYSNFTLNSDLNVFLRVSYDGTFCAYLNEQIIAFSRCSDYPNYKFYDEINLTKLCKKENILKICVWHNGEECMTYVGAKAGVVFEVVQGDDVLAHSSEQTLSRQMNEYKNGYLKQITMQLGLSFCYDMTASKTKYSESVTVDKPLYFAKRPTKQLLLGDRSESKILYETDKTVLIDLSKETVGFLDIDIESFEEQKIIVAYGEHIADGEVRRIIGNRDFSVEVILNKGRNQYVNYFRRLAGRYLQIYFEKPIKINYLGLKKVYYDIEVIEKNFNDPLIQQIYDTSVYTLRCCMFEHYEDCPWREQALYALDGRHQMLSGYFAFKNYDYQRANLTFMSKGLNENGLLDICFPIKQDRTIPSFSLFYVLAVCEYVDYSGDISIISEVSSTIETILQSFYSRIDETGLIPEFENPQWNFYEWNQISNGLKQQEEDSKKYNLILNTLFVYVAEKYNKYLTKPFLLDILKEKIDENFKLDDGTYKISNEFDSRSMLGNAMVILCGMGDQNLAKKIVEDTTLVDATLAMRGFVYDSLLKFGDEYETYIINDIKKRYKKMLDAGATTFWETENGLNAFCGAGSLCHGWSALPVYYFSKLKL